MSGTVVVVIGYLVAGLVWGGYLWWSGREVGDR